MTEFDLENELDIVETDCVLEYNGDENSVEKISGGGSSLMNQSHYSMKYEFFVKAITEAKKLKKITSKGKFLDLGSGFGRMVVVAATMGYDSYGIEFDSSICACSDKLVKHFKNKKIGRLFARKKIIKDVVACNVFKGTYFPDDYIDQRKNGETIAQTYEKNIKYHSSLTNAPDDSKLSLLNFQKQEIDVYDKFKIPLNEFDMWYSYCWGQNVPSLTETFSKYSKTDAIFIYSSCGQPEKRDELLEKLDLNVTRLFNTNWVGNTYSFDMITKK